MSSSTNTTTNSNTNSAILEDDQQLYDWGIENRLDQYYQVTKHVNIVTSCDVVQSVV